MQFMQIRCIEYLPGWPREHEGNSGERFPFLTPPRVYLASPMLRAFSINRQGANSSKGKQLFKSRTKLATAQTVGDGCMRKQRLERFKTRRRHSLLREYEWQKAMIMVHWKLQLGQRNHRLHIPYPVGFCCCCCSSVYLHIHYWTNLKVCYPAVRHRNLWK